MLSNYESMLGNGCGEEQLRCTRQRRNRRLHRKVASRQSGERSRESGSAAARFSGRIAQVFNLLSYRSFKYVLERTFRLTEKMTFAKMNIHEINRRAIQTLFRSHIIVRL